MAAEKARQDSIAQAELAAAKKLEEEARKAEEAALAAEKARQDSIAQAELAAAKTLEEEARKAEEAALAAEKARQDSIAQAELAAAKTLEEEARKAEEAALAAEKARQDSIAQAELAAAKTLEEEARKAEEAALAAEKARQDSIAQAELAAAKTLEEEVRKAEEAALAAAQARKDSIAQAELVLREKPMKEVVTDVNPADPDTDAKRVKAEQTMADMRAKNDSLNAMIQREKDMVKARIDSVQRVQQAMKDAQAAQTNLEKAPSTEDNITTAAEKDRQLLDSLITRQQSDIADIEKEKQASELIEQETKLATAQQDSAALSDAELFRQTVARIEAQKKAKEEQVIALAATEQEKRLREKQEQAEAARIARETAMEEARSVGDTARIQALERELAVADAVTEMDTSALVAELKSDADPAAYLAELSRVEQQMAKEEKELPQKDYSLKPLPEVRAVKPSREARRGADPALLERIEQDRRTVDEHRALAAEKELDLQQRMRSEREKLGISDPVLDEELRQAEELALSGAEPKGGKLALRVKSDAEQQDSVLVGDISDVTSADTPVLKGVEPKQKDDTAAVPTVSLVKEEVRQEMVIAPDEAVVRPDEKPIQKEERAEMAVSTEQVTETPKDREELPKPVAVVPEPAPVPAKTSVVKAPAIKTDMTSRPAALRDYSKRNVDFNAIENEAVRRMVQRMAAEDRGKMAVMKNVNNLRAAGSSDVASVVAAPRVAAILASEAAREVRQESTGMRFDRNDLRRRKGVNYRLSLDFDGIVLSEEVMLALNPAYAQTVVLPEVHLIIDHADTPVDIRRSATHLRGLGFDHVSSVPVIDGKVASVDAVSQMPFVDQ